MRLNATYTERRSLPYSSSRIFLLFSQNEFSILKPKKSTSKKTYSGFILVNRIANP